MIKQLGLKLAPKSENDDGEEESFDEEDAESEQETDDEEVDIAASFLFAFTVITGFDFLELFSILTWPVLKPFP